MYRGTLERELANARYILNTTVSTIDIDGFSDQFESQMFILKWYCDTLTILMDRSTDCIGDSVPECLER